ncbi:L,D-transpeptidase family protein [Anaerosporobacter sp.]|uniref:L,D-transpeptidase family protein n=1 Tax=Anaerosporobacter sp. TaxID=1872529 RepID=UPI00286F7322|nr:immunoglobulin-like domain-containing protein [Anaerosporobacter sp.]
MKELILRMQKRSKYLLMLSAILLTLFGIRTVKTMDAATNYPYMIKVNKQQNCVTVYGKDSKGKYTVPVKAMVCSTGTATPLGTYRTPVRYRWKILLDDVWGQYCTRITGGILFHSVWYYKQDPATLSATQYNKLGTMCSHGCIRLSVADAKWIYDNCPIGTTVTIYNSKDPGPLGKPVAIKLPANTGWDPTDIYYKNNPFNNKKPTISGAKDTTVKYGSTVNLLKGVTAKNTTGFSITARIVVSGKVNTKKAGKYKITYSVTDEIGRTAKKTVTYTVVGGKETVKEPTKEPEVVEVGTPKISGVTDRVVDGDTEITKELALEGVTATIGGKSVGNETINVTIKNNKDNTYTVTYELVASKEKTAKVTATITVDKEAPVIEGAVSKDISWDIVVDREFALAGITISDNLSKMTVDDIRVIIKEKEDCYIVTYMAEDAVGNKTSTIVTFARKDYLRFEGITDYTVRKGAVINEEVVLEGVTAYYNANDITDTISVSIEHIYDVNHETIGYKVVYVISDKANNDLRVTSTIMIDGEN